jgi:DNA end-binding protein Ku
MAPRAIWTGAITFGLVNVPARIYSAVHEHKLEFHMVHEKDDGPIGYQKICKLEDKPVDNDEIVKAYEYKKGELVPVTDKDFAAVEVEGVHTMNLEDFVAYDEIDPTFFAHTYLVGPQEGAEKTYALLVRAMEETGLAAIGKFVMRNRQYLGCLRVREGALTLEQMHFADEVDPPGSILPDKLPKVAKRELEMAISLIDGFSGEWEPKKYKDTYTDALMKVIEAKVKGQEIRPARKPQDEEPPDLLEALRQSIEQSKKQRDGRSTTRSPSRSKGRSSRHDDLDSLTKAELEKRAKKLGIEGRSKMSKEELAEAVAAAA